MIKPLWGQPFLCFDDKTVVGTTIFMLLIFKTVVGTTFDKTVVGTTRIKV
jgi:hypothetical protein